MFKVMLCAFICMPVSLSLVFEGACQDIRSKFSEPKITGYFYSFCKVFFEVYTQKITFFASNENDSVEFYVSDNDLFPLHLNTSCNERIGLQSNNKTKKPELGVFSVTDITSKALCLLKTEMTFFVSNKDKMFLIWGCANLKGQDKHDEAMWVLWKANTQTDFYDINSSTFDQHKSWIVTQVNTFSDINNDNLIFGHNTESKLNNNAFGCSMMDCKTLKTHFPFYLIFFIFLFILMICGIVVKTIKRNKVDVRF